MCFHNRQKRHGHSWVCCYSNTICKCDGRNRLFHFFRPSHFKDCVAIAMYLIVALFLAFLIEVCWLLYCVVHSQCKSHSWRSRTTENVLLEQNSVRRTFKCVATVTCLIMAAPHLVFFFFFFFFFFLRSAMVVYLCDRHKVSRLLTGKKRPILDLALMLSRKSILLSLSFVIYISHMWSFSIISKKILLLTKIMSIIFLWVKLTLCNLYLFHIKYTLHRWLFVRWKQFIDVLVIWNTSVIVRMSFTGGSSVLSNFVIW